MTTTESSLLALLLGLLGSLLLVLGLRVCLEKKNCDGLDLKPVNAHQYNHITFFVTTLPIFYIIRCDKCLTSAFTPYLKDAGKTGWLGKTVNSALEWEIQT